MREIYLKSLSAQDEDDYCNEKLLCGPVVAQDGHNVDSSGDGWMESVEYPAPRPPKKPGGWRTSRSQLSWVLVSDSFLSLGTTRRCIKTWLVHSNLGYLSLGGVDVVVF